MGLIKKIIEKINAPKPTTLPDDHTLHKETYTVIGTQYHAQSFSRLRAANPDWREAKKRIMESDLVGSRIYHYSYTVKPVDLKPDPSGQFGKNRIMVFVAGEHIGYLRESDDLHVGEILKYASVKYITAKITGGDYRIVYRDGTEQKNTDPLSVTVRIGYSA